MDIAAIRAEAAAVCQALGTVTGPMFGLAGWSFVPGDVGAYPAAVVNPPEEVTFHRTFSGGSGTVLLSISVAVSFEDPEDAQRRLDAAMSTGVVGSLYDAFRTHAGAAWSGVEYMKAGNWRLVAAGEGKALAADLTLEFSA